AVALFVDRAIHRPTDDERPEVAALVAELDHLPLAIELAAAATRASSLRALRTQCRSAVPPSDDPTRPDRHRSVTASLDVSWGLLSPWARAAAAQLSVFRSGFTVEAAEQVIDVAAWPAASWTLDVIEELVDASIVRVSEDGARMSLLQTVSRYATEHLAEPDRVAAELRHGRHFAAFGTPDALAALAGPREVEVARQLDVERDNLIVAAERAIDRGDAAVASATACAVGTRMAITGPLALAGALLDRVAALPDAEPRVHTVAGQVWLSAGELSRAEVHLDRVHATEPWAALASAEIASVRRAPPPATAPDLPALLARAHADGDRVLVCAVTLASSWRLRRQDDTAAALAGLNHALALATVVGARHLRARIAHRLGRTCAVVGRYDEGELHLRAAEVLALDVGDRLLYAQILADRAVVANRREDVADTASLVAALEAQRAVGDRRGEANALCVLGRAMSRRGELVDAERTLDQAVALARAIGMVEVELSSYGNLALVARRAGRLDEAERMLIAARDRAEASGLTRSSGLGSVNLGILYRERGRVDDARQALEASIDRFRACADDPSLGAALWQLGGLLADHGARGNEAAQARAVTLEALALYQRLGDRRFVGRCQAVLGQLDLADDDAVSARERLGAAVATALELEDGEFLAPSMAWLAEAERQAEAASAGGRREGA
ncbi:MAG: tetratricopeptide repeat protein, partial [Myxococcota bacterium]